jgi:hypothetical protein
MSYMDYASTTGSTQDVPCEEALWHLNPIYTYDVDFCYFQQTKWLSCDIFGLSDEVCFFQLAYDNCDMSWFTCHKINLDYSTDQFYMPTDCSQTFYDQFSWNGWMKNSYLNTKERL